VQNVYWVNTFQLFYTEGHKIKVITTVKAGALQQNYIEGIVLQNLRPCFKLESFTIVQAYKSCERFWYSSCDSRTTFVILLLAKNLFGVKEKKIFYQELSWSPYKYKSNTTWKKIISTSHLYCRFEQLKKTWAINEAALVKKMFCADLNIIIQNNCPLHI